MPWPQRAPRRNTASALVLTILCVCIVTLRQTPCETPNLRRTSMRLLIQIECKPSLSLPRRKPWQRNLRADPYMLRSLTLSHNLTPIPAAPRCGR